MSTEPDHKNPPGRVGVGEREENRDSDFSTEQAELVAACFKPAWEVAPQQEAEPVVPLVVPLKPAAGPSQAPQQTASTLVATGGVPPLARRSESAVVTMAGSSPPVSAAQADLVLQGRTENESTSELPPRGSASSEASAGSIPAANRNAPVSAQVDTAFRFDALLDDKRAIPQAPQPWNAAPPPAPFQVPKSKPRASSRVSDSALVVPMRGISKTTLAVAGILGALAIVGAIGGIRIMRNRSTTHSQPSASLPRVEHPAATTRVERVVTSAPETTPPAATPPSTPDTAPTIATVDTPSETPPSQPKPEAPSGAKQPTKAATVEAAHKSTTVASKPAGQKSGTGIVRDTPF